MRETRVFFGALCAAIFLWAAPPSTVTAMESWCEDDPPVVITTPGGASAIVYVTTGAMGVEHLPVVQIASIHYTVKPVKGGLATYVDMTVEVPNDLFAIGFPTRTTVSSGPFKTGTVYAAATGYAGAPMRLAFQLPLS
jgi:hypothetical protein